MQTRANWAMATAVLACLGGCEKPVDAPIAADVAVALALPQAFDEGPSEAQVVFQQGPPPPAKVKPKPRPTPVAAEPARPEPAKPTEPAKPDPKGLTIPTGDGTGSAAGTGRPPVPAPPPPPPPPVEKPRPQRISSLPPGNFDEGTATAFREIAVGTGGGVYASATSGALPGKIAQLLGTVKDVPDLDMAFLIDTTGSMKNDLQAMRGAAASMLAQAFARPGKTRVAVVYYKDKVGGCAYVTKIETPFTEDKGDVAGAFARAQVDCGGDEPEHVYAGIHRAATGLSWRPEAVKLIVLIGDASPHDDYTDVTKGMAMGAAKSRGIGVTSIIVAKD